MSFRAKAIFDLDVDHNGVEHVFMGLRASLLRVWVGVGPRGQGFNFGTFGDFGNLFDLPITCVISVKLLCWYTVLVIA